jgi:hypothetical protein
MREFLANALLHEPTSESRERAFASFFRTRPTAMGQLVDLSEARALRMGMNNPGEKR